MALALYHALEHPYALSLVAIASEMMIANSFEDYLQTPTYTLGSNIIFGGGFGLVVTYISPPKFRPFIAFGISTLTSANIALQQRKYEDSKSYIKPLLTGFIISTGMLLGVSAICMWCGLE